MFQTEDRHKFSEIALSTSIKLNVVERDDFANLIPESGIGGGTTFGRIWITNGKLDVYITSDSIIPQGFYRGRSMCVFNDKEKQADFSRMQDRTTDSYKESRKIAASKMMIVRDHSACGTRGNLNPSKRKDVKERIGSANSKKIILYDTEYESIKKATEVLKMTRYEIEKLIKDGHGYKLPT